MTTDVDICNMALDHVNAKVLIQSLDEKSKEAEACRRHYEASRNETTRLHDWGFSNAFERLALLDNPGNVGNWLYVYKYPVPCLRIWELLPEIDPSTDPAADPPPGASGYRNTGYKSKPNPVPFRLSTVGGSRVVLTNLPHAWARIGIPIEDPNLFDALFVTAFSYVLASKIAMPITGRRDKMTDMLTQRDRVILEASGADANEGPDDANFEADWIEDRV